MATGLHQLDLAQPPASTNVINSDGTPQPWPVEGRLTLATHARPQRTIMPLRMRPRPLTVPGFYRDVAVSSAVAAVYFGAGKLGLSLAFVNPSATAVWPPTGISLAALLLVGFRAWPGILVGAFLVNATTTGSVMTSAMVAAGNTLQALLGAGLVNRFAGGCRAFDRAADTLKFAALAGFASVVSATIGTTSLSLGGTAPWTNYVPIWFTWWLGDTVGVWLFAPLLVLWSTSPPPKWNGRRMLEAALVAMALIIALAVVGGGLSPRDDLPLEFLSIPPLIWLAFRFSPRDCVTATVAVSGIIIWGTLHGFGPFARTSQNESLLLVQAFMGVVGVTVLSVCAVVAERRRNERTIREMVQTLEQRVVERTADLQATNENLTKIVAEHQLAEEALRHSEARLSEILDIAQDAIVSVDDTQRITLFNQGAERIFGYAAHEMLGQPLGRLLPSRIAVTHAQHVTNFGASPAAARLMGGRQEVFGRRKDGTEFPAEASISKLVQQGRLTFTAIVRDVTQRKQLEEQIRQAQKMEAIGHLAGGVAHDFNNILTAVLGYCELVLDRIRDRPDIAADVEEITKAGERGRRLTGQLLALSRKQVLMPQVLDLNRVVSDVSRMLIRLVGESIRFEVIRAHALGRIKADLGQIEQVLLNLVVNARDAMPEGGTLTIRTANVYLDEQFVRRHPGSKSGPHVSLAVKDTGCGMTPAVLARMFEPFFTTKGSAEGTGLGLSSVHGFVMQSGGHIAVESVPGAGTSFTIYLPRVHDPIESSRTQAPSAHSLKGTETILVAEDEASVRALIRKVLEGYGYTVLVALDVADAIAIAERHQGTIDLLVSDVVMPELSGPAVAQRIARHQPTIQVLYVSGHPKKLALHLGPVGDTHAFLQKPFTAEALATKVRECLDWPTGQAARGR